MTNTEELRAALKAAVAREIEGSTSSGVLGAVICDDRHDAVLILQAAQEHLSILPLVSEMVEARKVATQSAWTAIYTGSGDFDIMAAEKRRAYHSEEYSDDEVLTVSGPDSRMFGGQESESNAKFITTAANNTTAIAKILNGEKK